MIIAFGMNLTPVFLTQLKTVYKFDGEEFLTDEELGDIHITLLSLPLSLSVFLSTLSLSL